MKPDKRNYTKAQIAAALNLYDETESITLVIQKLGYYHLKGSKVHVRSQYFTPK